MNLKYLALLLAAAGSFVISSVDAFADRRVALVIGNSAYVNAPALTNPRNDATDVSGALRRLGFTVIDGYDLNNVDLQRRVQEFAREVETADVAVFFYAGHGLQVAGENYLVPTDTALKRQADLDFETIKVDKIVKQMDVVNGPKIIILDACRDNPLAAQLARSMGGKSRGLTASGMSEMKTNGVTGTLIAFSTAPGSVAMDGDGRNSPFTKALLHHMETPGVDIDLMMKRVRGEVASETHDQQQPWTNSSLNSEFFLRPGAGGTGTASTPAAPVAVAALGNDATGVQIEIESWKTAQSLNTVQGYESYLARYPNGQFATFARQFVEKATAGVAASAPMPPQLKEERNNEFTEREIGLGSADWIEIQQRLNLTLQKPLNANGKVDKETRTAISTWQQKNGLNPSGFFSRDQYGWFKQSTQAKLDDFHGGRLALTSKSRSVSSDKHRSSGGDGSSRNRSHGSGGDGGTGNAGADFFGHVARGVGEGVGRGIGCKLMGGC